MRLLLAGTVLFAFSTAPSFAQTWTKLIAAGNGSCQSLILAGQATPCSHAIGLIYMLFENGKEMVSIGPSSGVVVSFVADSDSQPDATDYFMYLSHVDLYTKATQTVANVGGECEIKMLEDGTFWYSVSCTSKDANGSPYDLKYLFSNKPMSVKHF